MQYNWIGFTMPKQESNELGEKITRKKINEYFLSIEPYKSELGKTKKMASILTRTSSRVLCLKIRNRKESLCISKSILQLPLGLCAGFSLTIRT